LKKPKEPFEMMQKIVPILMLVLVLTLSLTTAANAASMPVGGCPTGFMLMKVMDHDMMEHMHVGLKVDLNRDGYLCMSEATSSIHVHMDNVVPLP
jgi:hypothetical protein